jgi:hypothetical protein
MNNEVMVDGITTSAIIVFTITLIFSLLSWFLLSWASKNISIVGVLLGIISGASLIIPFLQVLGLMAGVLVGLVAGLVAFMLQRKLQNPAKNQSLIIATISIGATYFVLSMIVLAFNTPMIWNTGVGIDSWTGTAEGLKRSNLDTILFSNIEFVFFPLIITSLLVTGLIIRGKRKWTPVP